MAYIYGTWRQWLFPALLPGCLLFTLSGCWKEELPAHPSIPGKRPVYVSGQDLMDIRNLPPREIVYAGTMFLRDTLFFLLEQGQGIHVYSVKDPEQSLALTFLRIPATSDFTVSGDRLYADSWRDLVTLDIRDIRDIRVLDRRPDVFQPPLFPPLYTGAFECVDPSRGAVVGWEDAVLDNPRCQTVR